MRIFAVKQQRRLVQCASATMHRDARVSRTRWPANETRRHDNAPRGEHLLALVVIHATEKYEARRPAICTHCRRAKARPMRRHVDIAVGLPEIAIRCTPRHRAIFRGDGEITVFRRRRRRGDDGGGGEKVRNMTSLSVSLLVQIRIARAPDAPDLRLLSATCVELTAGCNHCSASEFR